MLKMRFENFKFYIKAWPIGITITSVSLLVSKILCSGKKSKKMQNVVAVTAVKFSRFADVQQMANGCM